MNNKAESGKFIVFTIAEYFLALPIFSVLKVVNYPLQGNDNLRAAGLVQIGQHTLVLLDLHQKLATSYAPPLTRNSPFLVVTQVVQGELCAIPVDEPPNLVELPKDTIQTLPKSYHQNGLLDLVSHVAVFSHEEETFTIFLLDMNRVLSATTNSSTPRLIAG